MEGRNIERVHVIAPDGFDDPGRPTGGNIYDRRVCAGLAGAGWDVRVTTVAPAWPVPDAPGRGTRGPATVVSWGGRLGLCFLVGHGSAATLRPS